MFFSVSRVYVRPGVFASSAGYPAASAIANSAPIAPVFNRQGGGAGERRNGRLGRPSSDRLVVSLLSIYFRDMLLPRPQLYTRNSRELQLGVVQKLMSTANLMPSLMRRQ
jgi:hypothetical protein